MSEIVTPSGEPASEKAVRGVKDRVDAISCATRREEEWKDLALAFGELWSGLMQWFGEEGMRLPRRYVLWAAEGPEIRMQACLSRLEKSGSLIEVPAGSIVLPPDAGV